MRLEELPGFPAIYCDYVKGKGSARAFFPWVPDATSLRARAALIADATFPRGELRALLQEQAARFGSGSHALSNIEQLAAAETVAVVARVRPALFGGPLCSWLKILTAAKLASWISQNIRPAVPVVWITPAEAGQDLSAGILARHKLLRIEAENPGAAITGSMEAPLDRAARELGLAPMESDVFQFLNSAYAAGSSYELAWGKTIARLLDFGGLILLDASDPAFAAIQTPIVPMRRDAGRLQELRAAGYEPLAGALADPAPAIPWLFLQSPPLPTVAVIMDEFEAYGFAQELGALDPPAVAPVCWPRASATILSARDRKTLTRYKLELSNVLEGSSVTIEKLINNLNIETTTGKIREMRAAIQTGISRLMDSVPASRNLGSRIERVHGRMDHQVKKLERQFMRAAELRHQAMDRQITQTANALFPWGRLQERELAGFQFIFRHSSAFPQQLFDIIDIWNWQMVNAAIVAG